MSCSPGQDQGGRGELRQSACGVVVLDDGHLGEVGGDRLVQVPHPGFELGQFLGPAAEEIDGERPQRDVAHHERDAKDRRHVRHMANIREQNGPGAA